MRAPKTDAAWFPWLLFGLVMEWASWAWVNTEPPDSVAGVREVKTVVLSNPKMSDLMERRRASWWGGDVVHLDVVVGEHGEDVAVEGAVEHFLARDNHHDLAHAGPGVHVGGVRHGLVDVHAGSGFAQANKSSLDAVVVIEDLAGGGEDVRSMKFSLTSESHHGIIVVCGRALLQGGLHLLDECGQVEVVEAGSLLDDEDNVRAVRGVLVVGG